MSRPALALILLVPMLMSGCSHPDFRLAFSNETGEDRMAVARIIAADGHDYYRWEGTVPARAEYFVAGQVDYRPKLDENVTTLVQVGPLETRNHWVEAGSDGDDARSQWRVRFNETRIESVFEAS